MAKKYKMTNAAFLEWYYSDSDDIKAIGRRAIESLKSNGKFKISSQEILNECGYIPVRLLEDKKDLGDCDEVDDMSEIELTDIGDENN